jgi:DNA-binding protein H-NS
MDIMAKSYAQVMDQIEALKQQAEKLRKGEIAGVIQRIRDAVKAYGLTADDLGLGGGAKAAGAAPAAPAAVKTRKVRKDKGMKMARVAKAPKAAKKTRAAKGSKAGKKTMVAVWANGPIGCVPHWPQANSCLTSQLSK